MFNLMKPVFVVAFFVVVTGGQVATAQQPLKLGEKTGIEIKGNKRPIGCYTYTVVIPNKQGGKLRVEMSAAGNKLQVVVLDPNKAKGKTAYHNWGVAQLSGNPYPKEFQLNKLDWTMQDPMPQDKIYLQFQASSEGRVMVLVDWEKK